jgi:hypothetical protein
MWDKNPRDTLLTQITYQLKQKEEAWQMKN